MITKGRAVAAKVLFNPTKAHAWSNKGELWIACRASQRAHVVSIFGKPSREQSQKDAEGKPVSLCMIYKIGR